MRRFLRRYWPVLLVLLPVLAVAALYAWITWSTREPPNWSKIDDGLYLGGRVPKPPPGTQAVLNLCEAEDSYHLTSERWQPIHDAPPAPSLEWLESQVQFIESERSAGKTVYVHCAAGNSRGGMVVIAYYMKQNGCSRDEALEYVRQRRPSVKPNPAFMELLLEWEKVLKAKSSSAFLRHEPVLSPSARLVVHRDHLLQPLTW